MNEISAHLRFSHHFFLVRVGRLFEFRIEALRTRIALFASSIKEIRANYLHRSGHVFHQDVSAR